MAEGEAALLVGVVVVDDLAAVLVDGVELDEDSPEQLATRAAMTVPATLAELTRSTSMSGNCCPSTIVKTCADLGSVPPPTHRDARFPGAREASTNSRYWPANEAGDPVLTVIVRVARRRRCHPRACRPARRRSRRAGTPDITAPAIDAAQRESDAVVSRLTGHDLDGGGLLPATRRLQRNDRPNRVSSRPMRSTRPARRW